MRGESRLGVTAEYRTNKAGAMCSKKERLGMGRITPVVRIPALNSAKVEVVF